MHTSIQGDGAGAAPRLRRSRWLIALVGAVALTLGPGIGAAVAAEPISAVDGTEVSAADAATVTEPEPEPVIAQPAAVPVAPETPAVPVSEPVVEPVAEPVVEPVPEPVVEPVVEPVAEPPVAPVTPEAEVAAAADPPAEPAAEPLVEPAAPAAAPESALAEDAKAKTGKGSENPHNKVTLCHATGSEKNPYVSQTVNANGTASGHIGHQGGRDIIPPFTYNQHGSEKSYGGQNWDAAGQAIWGNGCKPVDPDPDPEPGSPVLSIDPIACIAIDAPLPETVAVTVSGLTEAGSWTLTVSGGSESSSIEVVGNGTYAIPVSGVGSYSVTIGNGEAIASSASFVVARCPDPRGEDKPVIEVPDLACVAVDAELPGSITVIVSGLVEPEDDAARAAQADEGAYVLRISGGSGGTATVPVGGNGSYDLPLSGTGTYTVELLRGDTIVASGSVLLERCEPTTPVTPPEPVNPPEPPAPPAPPVEPVEPMLVQPPMQPVPVPSMTHRVAPAAPMPVTQQQPLLAVTGAPDDAALVGAAALAVIVGSALLVSLTRKRRA